MSYNEQLRNLGNQFFEEHQNGATAKEIMRWAYERGLWQAHPDDLFRLGAEQLARAMRDDLVKDPQGREVRSKHVVIEDREGEQLPIWVDWKFATRDQMESSFQNRRRGIVSGCIQLRKDVDSYNENFNTGVPIQIPLNFANDVEEAFLVAGQKKSVRRAV
jgi:hypothetical protein